MGLFGIYTVSVAVILYSTKVLYKTNESRRFRGIVESSFRTHEICQEEKCPKINKIDKMKYGYSYNLTLPSGVTIEKLRKTISAIEQDTYSKIRFKHIKGRNCILDFGLIDLKTKYDYSEDLPKEGLTVPFYTHFGLKTVDFWEESFWHCLIGGAAGMGKSVLLYYILTHLFLTTKGNMNLHISSAKVRTDFYMYKNIPQISLHETIEETKQMLESIVDEAERRKELLEQHEARDIRTLREETGMDIPPVFIVVDEYAELADAKEIQEYFSYISRVCRYLDFHLIICTQRPSATEAIPPQVRANLLGNIALSCRDDSNSRMIIGTNEASLSKLGGIKGRAILLNGFTEEIQVPYISTKQIQQLLQPFYRSEINEPKRCANHGLSKEVPSFIEGPTGEIVFSGEQKPISRRKPSHEKTPPRGKSVHRHATKRQVLPVYAEPDYHSPEQHQD